MKPDTSNMLPIEKLDMEQFISEVDRFINRYATVCNVKSSYADLHQELQDDLISAQKEIDDLKLAIEDYKTMIFDLTTKNEMLLNQLKKQEYLIDTVLDAALKIIEE